MTALYFDKIMVESQGEFMKTSTLNRSMLSGESMALLAELKSLNEESERESANINNSMQSKQDELDILWQNFKAYILRGDKRF